jgi:hypothetical protein
VYVYQNHQAFLELFCLLKGQTGHFDLKTMAKLSKGHIELVSLSINVWILGTESQDELETRRIVFPFILTALGVIRVSMAKRMPKRL